MSHVLRSFRGLYKDFGNAFVQLVLDGVDDEYDEDGDMLPFGDPMRKLRMMFSEETGCVTDVVGCN